MVPGKVLATGGMVAKLVGVTLTTVVATPKVSPPHADIVKSEMDTKETATAVLLLR